MILRIEEEFTGMEGGFVRCGSCGLERQKKVSDHKLCQVLARNIVLEEEVKEMKVFLASGHERQVRDRRGTSRGLWVGEERESEPSFV